MSGLTEREKEIIKLVAKGYTNIGIGKMIYTSPATVKTHLSNIYDKLGVPIQNQHVNPRVLLTRWVMETVRTN